MRKACLAMLLCLCAVPPALAAPAPTPWVPQQSWPGGAQYDARLEHTVQFWGAGVPLARVFAEVRAQTGIAISFWPADDDNARLCVNLFLNPARPPTMREFLAQLAWATDCSFAYDGSVNPPAYQLLHTSAGAGVLDEAKARRAQRIAEQSEHYAGIERQMREQFPARLAEFREALSLSREEAVRRYRGTDDVMLLALVDPARRSTGQLILSLSPAQLEEAQRAGQVFLDWAAITAEQRALFRGAAQPWIDAALAGRDEVAEYWRQESDIRWDDWRSIEAHLSEVLLYPGGDAVFGGRLDLVPKRDASGRPVGAASIELIPLRLVPYPGRDPSSDPRLQLEIRRALGESIPDEQLARAEEERRAQEVARNRRHSIDEQLSQHCRLSAAGRDRLAATHLPVAATLDAAYTLWQVQEAAAAATGFSVVSDCFWQPRRGLSELAAGLPPSDPASLTALEALQLASLSEDQSGAEAAETMLGRGGDSAGLSWEWGDAGNILRFRSVARGLWRSAFLPEGAVETLRSWLRTHVPDDAKPLPSITVPVDLRARARLIDSLTEPQRTWGGFLTYGDPTDRQSAYLLPFAHAALERADELIPVYHLLAGLDDEQWEQLQADGLAWSTSVRPDLSNSAKRPEAWRDLQKGDVLRLTEQRPPAEAISSMLYPGDGWLEVVRAGRSQRSDALLRRIAVEPEPAGYLPRGLGPPDPPARPD